MKLVSVIVCLCALLAISAHARNTVVLVDDLAIERSHSIFFQALRGRKLQEDAFAAGPLSDLSQMQDMSSTSSASTATWSSTTLASTTMIPLSSLRRMLKVS